MKKLLLAAVLVLNLGMIHAQSDSAQIIKLVDEMSNDSHMIANNALILVNNTNTSGFSIKLDFREEKGKITQDGLICKMIGIGTCVENNELIIMFTDSTKITLKSWNKFNCDGNAWFSITDQQAKELSTKQLLKIKIQNGRTFESLTKEVDDNANDYFINLLAQAAANKYILKKE
jgi:hypothetical protein